MRVPGWLRRRKTTDPPLDAVCDEPPSGQGGVGEACSLWRQGDVFRGARTYVFDAAWAPRPIAAVDGAVAISQSCDAAHPGRERIQIAPLVLLENSSDLAEAAAGRRPQYVAVPQLGEGYFADLDGITTVFKSALLPCTRELGVKTDSEVRDFAFSVARRFGRFAYPDEVVECLRPVTEAIRKKARKEQSPMGKALADVHSFRVSCEDWSRTPRELTLIVVMQAGAVPLDPDEVGEVPDGLAPPTEERLGPQITDYANRLSRSGLTRADRYYGWQYLADAWALQCQVEAKGQGLADAVASVTAELVSVDDFPLSRFERTEALDLDYLSDSRKPIS